MFSYKKHLEKDRLSSLIKTESVESSLEHLVAGLLLDARHFHHTRSPVLTFKIANRIKRSYRILSGSAKQLNPSYLIVLNFEIDDCQHMQHVFFTSYEHEEQSLYDLSFDEFLEIGSYDGAMLIDKFGKIKGKKVILIDLHKILYTEISESVMTRHFSAQQASGLMQGTVVYTLSEETANIRRYKAGKETFSTSNFP